MKSLVLPIFLAGAVCASLLAPLLGAPAAQEPGEQPMDMGAMMAAAAKYTQPGDHHEVLERFLGEWDTEWRITMAGMEMPPSKGTSKSTWLMDGRWIQGTSTGALMGMDMESHMIMGYDNFKQSYVITMVNNMDTAMLRAEGDMDPNGKVLLAYGTLDEYLTGEHDKMVKYVWRFESEDKIIFEIHDLPIGEKNTKVIEVVSTRKKTSEGER